MNLINPEVYSETQTVTAGQAITFPLPEGKTLINVDALLKETFNYPGVTFEQITMLQEGGLGSNIYISGGNLLVMSPRGGELTVTYSVK
jgi:hypothetical protein